MKAEKTPPSSLRSKPQVDCGAAFLPLPQTVCIFRLIKPAALILFFALKIAKGTLFAVYRSVLNARKLHKTVASVSGLSSVAGFCSMRI